MPPLVTGLMFQSLWAPLLRVRLSSGRNSVARPSAAAPQLPAAAGVAVARGPVLSVPPALLPPGSLWLQTQLSWLEVQVCRYSLCFLSFLPSLSIPVYPPLALKICRIFQCAGVLGRDNFVAMWMLYRLQIEVEQQRQLFTSPYCWHYPLV